MARRGGEEQGEALGTPAQINQRILALRQQGLTLTEIGRRVGLGTSTVKYRLDALGGKRRVSVSRKMCEGCWDDFPADQLDHNGLCPACV